MYYGLGIQPIRSKFLQPNYLLALEFKEGFVFGRVVRRRICRYKPYPVIDANGNTVDISPSSHQTELRFRDPRNTKNDILYLDTATNAGYAWILHGSIGIKPQYIYMYPKFPEGKEIPGKFPSLDPIRPASGDDFGYVNSDLSPYEDPSDYVEYVIPPGLHMAAEYYNKDSSRSHQPVLHLLFSVYWIQVLKPDKHGKLISDIAARRVPAAFLTVGFGNTPVDLGDKLKKEWEAVPLTLDEAVELR